MLAPRRRSRNICWVDWFVVAVSLCLGVSGKLSVSSVHRGLCHSCVMTEGGGSWVRPAGLGWPTCHALPLRLSRYLGVCPRPWQTDPLSQGLPREEIFSTFSGFGFCLNVKSYDCNYFFSFLKYTWNTRGTQEAWSEERGKLSKVGRVVAGKEGLSSKSHCLWPTWLPESGSEMPFLGLLASDSPLTGYISQLGSERKEVIWTGHLCRNKGSLDNLKIPFTVDILENAEYPKEKKKTHDVSF